MKEKNFQQEFRNKNAIPGVFELKLCKSTSLPFSNIAPHQLKALSDAGSDAGLYHKLTDQPVSFQQDRQNIQEQKKQQRFTRPAPFDCFFLKNIPAYLVVMFYTPRKKKNVYYIAIDSLLEMIEHAGRKSMTESMAQRYASHTDNYLKKRSLFRC
ncbi:MAG: hypothetical protein DRZ76_01760 [Candidatus Nealsonbacteria bacterium]|nr:MAG: hypothetical protein DRZ76_01760 [Candidatus Nealsonbacteria bacterium]